MTLKISAIIEARTGSSRLPGKVVLNAGKKNFLEHLIERLKKLKSIDNIIIATTTNPSDYKIVKIAKKENIKFYRGSEKNVLQRVIDAGKKFKSDIIVRITSDCPIIDINIVDQVISIFLSNNCDYVSNSFIRSYPDGMDVEVFSLKTLMKSKKYLKRDVNCEEYITLAIRRNPKIFSHLNVIAPLNLYYPKLALTLDEKEDYIFLKKIINFFEKKNNKFFTCLDVINLLKNNKKWLLINKKIKRTKYIFG